MVDQWSKNGNQGSFNTNTELKNHFNSRVTNHVQTLKGWVLPTLLLNSNVG